MERSYRNTMHDSKRVCLKEVIIILEKTVQKRHERWQCASSNKKIPRSCVSTTLQTRPPSSVSQSAHTHVTHRMCVRTQITWTWLCTRGKKQYKYCSFSHTNRSFCCLRPSMCSYDGELFNLDFSVHVLFPSYRDSDLYLPLYDWQTRTVWPKNIKIGSTEEKKTPTSWIPLG